jgi:hypothetical protein
MAQSGRTGAIQDARSALSGDDERGSGLTDPAEP